MLGALVGLFKAFGAGLNAAPQPADQQGAAPSQGQQEVPYAVEAEKERERQFEKAEAEAESEQQAADEAACKAAIVDSQEAAQEAYSIHVQVIEEQQQNRVEGIDEQRSSMEAFNDGEATADDTSTHNESVGGEVAKGDANNRADETSKTSSNSGFAQGDAAGQQRSHHNYDEGRQVAAARRGARYEARLEERRTERKAAASTTSQNKGA